MILAVSFFALTNMSVKFVSHIPLMQVVFFRGLVSTILALATLRYLGVPLKITEHRLLLARALFGVLGLVGFFYTIQSMPLASAASVHYLAPLVTVIVAQWILKEKPLPIQWLFFVIAFIGVLIVKGFDPRVGTFEFIVGLLSVVAAAIAYNIVRALRGKEHEMIVVLSFPLVTIPVSLPFAWAMWQSPHNWDWLWLLAIGLFTHIAQIFLTKAFQRAPVANVAIFNYLGIVYAAIIGFWVFDEEIEFMSSVGMLVIFFAVLLNTLVVKNKSKTAQ